LARPTPNCTANISVTTRESWRTRGSNLETRTALAAANTIAPEASARNGCSTRKRRNTCASGERSIAIPARSDVAGKSVSPRAAIAPLHPSTSTAASARKTAPRRSGDAGGEDDGEGAGDGDAGVSAS